MSPDARVFLDRRIAEEGMTELHTPGEEPWGCIPDTVNRIWTMDAGGVVSGWHWPDCTPWTDAVAYRMEDDLGNPMQPMTDDDDEEMDGEIE